MILKTFFCKCIRLSQNYVFLIYISSLNYKENMKIEAGKNIYLLSLGRSILF